ncbi:MAG: tetratricopeptide repeat protein [Bacteroidetes bacterium]|nr:tetratricopeptide repeat protein [Bacteroidota bacterium]
MKTNKLFLFLISVFLFLASLCHSQSNVDEQLAQQYFQNKEFEKALVYFEKLFAKNPITYYENYLSCLVELKDFKSAEKVVKRIVKQNPLTLRYNVDLGWLYRLQGEQNKMKEEFEKAIKQLQPSQEQAEDLAQAFMKIKEWDYAIATYKKAQRMMKDMYPYNFELAEVHAAKADWASMINEYLDLLELNEGYLQSVQSAAITFLGKENDDKKIEIVKTELLKRIQKSSDNVVFSELLIWLQMQQKDFEGALLQAKALDKRKKEEGRRIMSLADIFTSNGAYDLAIKAYEFVIAKGNQNENYINARMQLLDVLYKKVVEKGIYTTQDIVSLEANYIQTLTDIGKSASSVNLLKSLAHIQAFYLNKNQDAIGLLQEAIALPGVNSVTQAECKLALGDVHLFKGDVWEASLTYSQVEKAYKYDAIGQEAKLKNAKISYYTGDFKWAQAQLDVLKGATSKLIANDAMDLSLLIADNLGLDTNTAPLLLFAQADLYFFQTNYSSALAKLDSINLLFPNHTLDDNVLFRKYQIAYKQSKYDSCAMYLEKIIANYSYDILADDATFLLAELYQQKLNNKEKAMAMYQDVLTKFPASLFVVEARKRFRLLRGDGI